jgi:hypothetical protein
MLADSKPGTSATETVRQVLRLLREHAPAAAYRRLIDDTLPDERRELRKVVDEALETRRMVDERRRREAELAALYETAGDLSSLRDLEAVLQAIVRRARDLLHTDAAYMMLND